MPLYEYKCHSCGKIFEVIQKFADEPLKTHPDCGGEVERLLSAPAFHLKGTGWYATDYGKGSGGTTKSTEEKSDNKAAAKEKSDSGSSSSGSDSKSSSSDSKPGASESKPASSPAPAASSSESK